jgi:lysophospholipase L1-like esterase
MKASERSQPITVVFMGDSITEGQYVHHSVRWTALVSSSIRKQFASTESELHFFFNRGVSGETTRQGLERFPRDVQNVRPDIMTLQFGLNDCNCWDTDLGLSRVSEAAYRANLIEMIDRARRFGAKRIILSTNHPTLRHAQLASGESLEQRRVRYNNIVRNVAVVTGVTLCDIEQAFSRYDRPRLAELLLPPPDVLHLSKEGHSCYASVILRPLVAAVKDVIRLSEFRA